MSSNPPEDTGPDTSSTPSPTDTGSTPGPTTPEPTTPEPNAPQDKPAPKKPGLLKRAASALGNNIANQLTNNMGKGDPNKKNDKDKKPEDLMKLVDSLSDTVANINGGLNSLLGKAIQKGFDSIVAKFKGDK